MKASETHPVLNRTEMVVELLRVLYPQKVAEAETLAATFGDTPPVDDAEAKLSELYRCGFRKSADGKRWVPPVNEEALRWVRKCIAEEKERDDLKKQLTSDPRPSMKCRSCQTTTDKTPSMFVWGRPYAACGVCGAALVDVVSAPAPAPTAPPLSIQGHAGTPIWMMCDGQEPFTIGVRLDCGDGGVVYLSREQATDLAHQLQGTVKRLDSIDKSPQPAHSLVSDATAEDDRPVAPAGKDFPRDNLDEYESRQDAAPRARKEAQTPDVVREAIQTYSMELNRSGNRRLAMTAALRIFVTCLEKKEDEVARSPHLYAISDQETCRRKNIREAAIRELLGGAK